VPTATATDGAALAFEATGKGPNLLFLHGWAGSGDAFHGVIGHLDLTRLRVISVDLRGHGNSDTGDGDYSLDRLTDDALAAADAAGADDLVVLGFSMGAKFAQHLTLTAPDRVAGLILVAGCPAGEIPLPPELLDDWCGRTGDAAKLAEVTLQYSSNPIDPEELERWGRNAAVISRPTLQGTLETCIATSFDDQIGAVAAPTLVVGGTTDAIFTPALMRDAVAGPIAGARLVLVDAGHEILLEAPAKLAALVEAFLAGLGR
jgi:pimeloyl-ACP methyl ester carboxylesterase